MILWFGLTGCVGTGTNHDAANAHRPVTAPVSSAARLGQEFLSPESITRSLDRMLDSAHTIASLETQRLKGLPDQIGRAHV